MRCLLNGGLEGVAWSNDKRINKRVPVVFGMNDNERSQRFDFDNSLGSGAPSPAINIILSQAPSILINTTRLRACFPVNHTIVCIKHFHSFPCAPVISHVTKSLLSVMTVVG